MKKVLQYLKNIVSGTTGLKRILFTAAGAAAGYAYYYYVGCASGACPISSNPWISTFYGAAVGFLLAASGKSALRTGE